MLPRREAAKRPLLQSEAYMRQTGRRAHYCIPGKLPVLDTGIDNDIETVTGFPVKGLKFTRHCDHYLWPLLQSVEATRNTFILTFDLPTLVSISQHLDFHSGFQA